MRPLSLGVPLLMRTRSLLLLAFLATTASGLEVQSMQRALRMRLMKALGALGLGEQMEVALMTGVEDGVRVAARPADILTALPNHTNPDEMDAPHAIWPPTPSACSTFAVRELVVEHNISEHWQIHFPY